MVKPENLKNTGHHVSVHYKINKRRRFLGKQKSNKIKQLKGPRLFWIEFQISYIEIHNPLYLRMSPYVETGSLEKSPT